MVWQVSGHDVESTPFEDHMELELKSEKVAEEIRYPQLFRGPNSTPRRLEAP